MTPFVTCLRSEYFTTLIKTLFHECRDKTLAYTCRHKQQRKNICTIHKKHSLQELDSLSMGTGLPQDTANKEEDTDDYYFQDPTTIGIHYN